MQKIIYPNENNGVSIITICPEARRKILINEAIIKIVTVPMTDNQPEYQIEEIVKPATYRDETDSEFILWVAKKDVPFGKPYQIINDDDIPQDNTFREAWEYSE
jgi:hypothetical protein